VRSQIINIKHGKPRFDAKLKASTLGGECASAAPTKPKPGSWDCGLCALCLLASFAAVRRVGANARYLTALVLVIASPNNRNTDANHAYYIRRKGHVISIQSMASL